MAIVSSALHFWTFENIGTIEFLPLTDIPPVACRHIYNHLKHTHFHIKTPL